MAIQSFRCHDNFFHLCLDKGDIIKRDNYEYFITMTSSYKPTAEVKNKITLNNYDEDDIKASGYTRTPK